MKPVLTVVPRRDDRPSVPAALALAIRRAVGRTMSEDDVDRRKKAA